MQEDPHPEKSGPKPHLAGVRRFHNPVYPEHEVVRLDQNEPNYVYDAEIMEGLRALITPSLIHRYPDCESLKEKIIAAPLMKAGTLKPSQVILSAGADGAIRFAFEAYVDPGDTVAYLDPTYGMVPVYTDLFRARPYPIPHTPDLEIDVEAIRRAIRRRPRLLVMANPNSPTGAVLDQADLLDLLRLADGLGVAALVDEAYFLFWPETVLPALNRFEQVLVCRSFSKALGLPGLRLGFLAAPEDGAGLISALRPPDEIHAIAVAWGKYLLDRPWAIERGVRSVMEGKKFLEENLKRKGYGVHPTTANFLLVEWRRDQAVKLAGRLLEAGFAVKAGLRAAGLENFMRITAAPCAVMERFLDALEKCEAFSGESTPRETALAPHHVS